MATTYYDNYHSLIVDLCNHFKIAELSSDLRHNLTLSYSHIIIIFHIFHNFKIIDLIPHNNCGELNLLI